MNREENIPSMSVYATRLAFQINIHPFYLAGLSVSI